MWRGFLLMTNKDFSALEAVLLNTWRNRIKRETALFVATYLHPESKLITDENLQAHAYMAVCCQFGNVIDEAVADAADAFGDTYSFQEIIAALTTVASLEHHRMLPLLAMPMPALN